MINKVTLIGNLGKDPETTNFDGGGKVLKMSMATSKSYLDKQGSWQEKTTWHNLVFWNKSADKADSYVKGETIYIEGEIDNRSYDDSEGNKKYISEVVVSYSRRVGKKEEGCFTSGVQIPQDQMIPRQSADFEDMPF